MQLFCVVIYSRLSRLNVARGFNMRFYPRLDLSIFVKHKVSCLLLFFYKFDHLLTRTNHFKQNLRFYPTLCGQRSEDAQSSI